ncbi:MAG: adenylate/guanylate cyclase domain-containing protein, partial [Myxococcota bacterium]|nr:adenylate/guanylate cyclase domain-containing protein [Myxococcota bacterium]
MCGRAGLPADARFCPRCGERLALGTPPAAAGAVAERPDGYTPEHLRREVLTTRSALEGERKHVAVLMADVVDSLATADALDPEQVHEMMGGFFELALEAVHRHGGTINQFRGDGFMALFGAPRTRGGEALRAVRAALELDRASRAYGESMLRRFGVPLLLRMGVHAGLVWVGAIGSERRRDYTAEGATVGVAARLERLAEPGQLLVSVSVAQAVAHRVGTRDLGTRRHKGVREPMQVFEVTGEPPEGSSPDADDEEAGGTPPLRGRERELQRIARQRAAVGVGGACLVEVRGA